MTEPQSAPERLIPVVAAVIERDGRFLGARRTEPEALRGLWEFPGGKTEPGEDDVAALIRECREELGVEIAVGDPVGPEYVSPNGRFLVRTYRAELLAGEPAAIENHDAVRWFEPGTPEVREVPWLEGDLVILDVLDAEAAPGTRVA